MPELSARFRARGTPAGGGLTGYPLDRLHEEIAFLAYYVHWDHATLLALEHGERRRWCQEVGRINRQVSGGETERSIEEVF